METDLQSITIVFHWKPSPILQCQELQTSLNQNSTKLSKLYRGSYMSAHVLLNLLNELGKRDKMRGLPSILSLFATHLINSIIQEHEC